MRSFVLKATALLVLLLLGAWGALELASRRAQGRLEERFSSLFDGRGVLERFPPTAKSSTVAELEAIGTELGIEMDQSDLISENPPTPEAAERWSRVHAALRDHLLELRGTTRPERPELGEELERFLADSTSQLERIRELLIHGEAPVWRTDLNQGFEMRIPNYLGLLSLQKVLLADAGRHWSRGEIELFEADLEASWRLREAIAESPTLIAQLIANAVLRDQVPLWLRMSEVSAKWEERIASLRPLDGIRRGLQMEAWVAYHAARNDLLTILNEGEPPWFAWSYIRWGLLQHAELMLEFVDRLPVSDFASFDPQAFFEEQMDRIPRWNVIGRLIVPNLYDAWTKAAYDELTVRLVAEVWSLRRGGDAPASASGASGWRILQDGDTLSVSWTGDRPAVPERAVPLEFAWSIARVSGPEEAGQR